MEYEISDDQGFAGDYETPSVRHRPVANSHDRGRRARPDHAVHIPDEED